MATLLVQIEAFEAKLQGFPQGCFVLGREEFLSSPVPRCCEDANTDSTPSADAASPPSVMAYLISSPSPTPYDIPVLCSHRPTPLPSQCSCYFIHEVTVDPRFHGRGFGKRLARHGVLLAKSFNFTTIALVCVQKSEIFWERIMCEIGSVEIVKQDAHKDGEGAQKAKASLRKYGPDAVLMVVTFLDA
jgi:predicted GNAT family acetyltransferase